MSDAYEQMKIAVERAEANRLRKRVAKMGTEILETLEYLAENVVEDKPEMWERVHDVIARARGK